MLKLFTREQARKFLKENNLKDGVSIADALKVLKTSRSKFGNVELNIPEDKKGEFEPVIVPKHSREVHPSINDMIFQCMSKE
ncbi:MAG: transposase [Candidatus Gastranaerophilales bacterium]|nr:transposase [Candidatus Gastranaerophilales bacterium]